jgi:hypothetical protein
MRTSLRRSAFAGLLAASLISLASAQDVGGPTKEQLEQALPKPPYSPYVDRDFPTRPFFGDTHLHTAFSMDAGAFGARLSPRDAYRFARGEQITSNTGQPVKLSRPLDFLVVTDHSDNMGFFPDLFAGKPDLLADPTGRKWYDMIKSGKGADAAIEIIVAFSHGTFPKDLMYFPGTRAYRSAWQETIAAAEHFNEAGRFTAFIGYEWTSNTGGNNLHRNVVFRDNGDKASQVEPFTVYPPFGSDNPVELWKWMDAYEKKTGGSVLAIAHNGNLSNGLMFPVVEAFGKRLDREYAEQRAKWERLYEATQTKGTGESHPLLSPNDEFAAFEIWDKGNLDGSVAKKPEMLEFEYVRSAYKNGLKARRCRSRGQICKDWCRAAVRDRGRRERHLDQHDRRTRTHHGLEGPGIRSGPACLLLRAGDRDSDPALDGLRCETIRGATAARHCNDRHRTCLYLADLVHAGEVARSEAIERVFVAGKSPKAGARV